MATKQNGGKTTGLTPATVVTGSRPSGGYETNVVKPVAAPLEPWLRNPPVGYEGDCQHVPPAE